MRVPRDAALGFALLWLGCGGDKATLAPAEPPITEADFAQPWVLRDRAPSGNDFQAIAHGHAGFVAITQVPTTDGKGIPPQNNMLAISVDGLNWGELRIEPDGYYWSIAYGQGRYVAVGGQMIGGGEGLILASDDGRRWTRVAGGSAPFRKVRHTPAGFVAAGVMGAVLLSSDGLSWSETPDPGRFQVRDANFGAGRFVAAGIKLSTGTPNGPWANLPCGAQLPCGSVTDPSGNQHVVLDLMAIEYGNGFFLTKGSVGLLRSADGLAWQKVGDGGGGGLGFAGGRFFLGLPDSVLSDSVDGQTWTRRAPLITTQTDHTCTTSRCIVLQDALLVVPGR